MRSLITLSFQLQKLDSSLKQLTSALNITSNKLARINDTLKEVGDMISGDDFFRVRHQVNSVIKKLCTSKDKLKAFNYKLLIFLNCFPFQGLLLSQSLPKRRNLLSRKRMGHISMCMYSRFHREKMWITYVISLEYACVYINTFF